MTDSAKANDKAYEIKIAIKNKLDEENRHFKKICKQLEEVQKILRDPHTKDSISYNKYQELVDKEKKLYERSIAYADTTYALETAYNICLDVLEEAY